MNRSILRDIRKQLEDQSLYDLVKNNAPDVGWNGFTYYKDTIAFFEKHEVAIMHAAKEKALGDGYHYLSDWLKAKGYQLRILSTSEIETALNCKAGDDYRLVANSLTWWTLLITAQAWVEANPKKAQ